MKSSPETSRLPPTVKRSPWKYYYIIFLGVAFIVASIVVVENTPSGFETQSIAQRELEDVPIDYSAGNEIVVVTLKSGEYHQPDCPWIEGKTKRMTVRKAKQSGFKPCPYCNEYE